MIKRFFQQLEQFDIYLFNRLAFSIDKKILQCIAIFLTRLGDGAFYAIAGPIAMFITLNHPWHALGITLLAMSIEKTTYFFLKKRFKRQRPLAKLPNVKQVIAPPDEFSFPSGHTASAFCMATMLSCFFPIFAPIFFTIASLIGFSRLVLQVHFPLDVLAGSALGVGAGFLVLSVFN